jgi:phosphopantothenoylcysteine decarboxylase/phosphopantothenate--cysteine ligase
LGSLPLFRKNFLITAGPTVEPIDPVRFIGNHSSGKMGFALAQVAADLGAEVTLITGPVHLRADHDSIQTIPVTSAEDMYEAVHKHFEKCDVAILSAAVADYRPKEVADNKIKKKDSNLTIELVKTKDILESLGTNKTDKYLVGFALETENEIENAKTKLKKKNLDLIVLNSLNDKGAGFRSDTNKVTLIDKDNKMLSFDVKPKKDVALDIVEYIIKDLHA